jgi:hypothetical protein
MTGENKQISKTDWFSRLSKLVPMLKVRRIRMLQSWAPSQNLSRYFVNGVKFKQFGVLVFFTYFIVYIKDGA